MKEFYAHSKEENNEIKGLEEWSFSFLLTLTSSYAHELGKKNQWQHFQQMYWRAPQREKLICLVCLVATGCAAAARTMAQKYEHSHILATQSDLRLRFSPHVPHIWAGSTTDTCSSKSNSTPLVILWWALFHPFLFSGKVNVIWSC